MNWFRHGWRCSCGYMGTLSLTMSDWSRHSASGGTARRVKERDWEIWLGIAVVSWDSCGALELDRRNTSNPQTQLA
jgi:hypothetical protein